MKKARTIVPLAALALLASLLLQSPSAQEASVTKTDTRSAPDESRAGSATHTVSGPEDDPFNALDVLAESFGVDISREGLERMTRREARILRSGRSDARVHEADEFVWEFLKLVAAELEISPSDADTAETLNGVIDLYFNQPKLDTTQLRFDVLRRVAARLKTDVNFLIATLPDPIDSFTGWQFDPMLDAISQAVSASDYIFERFRFPDSEPDRGRKSASTRGRAHEDELSVVLYRRHVARDHAVSASGGDAEGSWNHERLVLLVVHENPSAGVHARALVNAMGLVTRWHSKRCPAQRPTERCTIRILGPTFSGSADSIARELAQADRRHLLDDYSVRFVSGSATDDWNKTVIEGAIAPLDPGEGALPEKRVTFHATVQPDSALLPKLIEQVNEAGWSFPIAVLFEGNTQYGRSLMQVLKDESDERPRSEMILLPFPMNISRLRGATQDEKLDKVGLADALGLPSKFRPLSMESTGNPADQLPQFSPKTTASYIELAVSGMLQTMRAEHVRTVALMATDPRDKLFLARQIKRDSPNVSIFTAESDSLYVHPDYSSYLHGALIASTYPLYSGNQRWSYGFQGSSERREFSSGSAKGIYNAALALLNYDADGLALKRPYAPGETAPRLLEYGAPGQDCSKGCQPPVWISVVGRKSTWPMKVYSMDGSTAPTSDVARVKRVIGRAGQHGGDEDGYVLPIRMDDVSPPERLATYPSPFFTVAAIALTGLVLVCWAGIRMDRWRLRNGLRCRLATLVTRDNPEPGRAYLLVAVASLLTMEAFLGVVCLTRFRLDTWSWEGSSVWSVLAVAAVAVAVIALLDLANQIVRRMATHDRASLTQRFDLTTVAGWVRGLSVMFCVGAAFSLLWYAWAQAVLPRADAVSFAARAVDLGSGVSPTLPVLFLGAAFTLWSLAELARLRSPAVALTDETVRPLMEQTMSGGLEKLTPDWALLNRSTVAVPPALAVIAPVMVVGVCLFLFDPIFRPLVTIDGPWFGRFVSAGILIVQWMITLSLLQFVYLWYVLKHLLHRIAAHSPVHAYETVPRALFPAGLFPSLPSLMEIEVIVQHWQTTCEETGQAREAAALRESLASEMASASWPHWSASQTWRSLVHTAAQPSDQPGTKVPAERTALREMCAAIVIRDAIARLWHNLVFVIGGVLFVFCSHTMFPFQIQQQLSEVGWIYVAVTFGAILVVLIQMKRNDILQRLTSPEPTERAGWDSSFVWRVAVFALLPLLTLFTAQFPDIGQVLVRWIDPVRQVLP